MNHQTPFRRALPFVLTASIAATAFIHAGSGANFVMNAGDAINTNSFTTGLHWPGGAAPAPGNTYQTGAFLLRTPNSGTLAAPASFTFAGDSLEVQTGGTLRNKTIGTITIGNLILATNAIVELTQPGAPVVNNNTATGTLAGGITLNGTAIFHAGIAADAAGETFTIASTITGAGGFQTTGSNGIIILTGSNNFTGPVTINGLANSKLQLGSANAVQNSTVTISLLDGLTFSDGIGSFNVGGLAGASSETLNDLSGAGVTLEVGANNASTTYSGNLSGLGGLTKAGTGTLTLSGFANSYSGATTVNNGVLHVTGALNSDGAFTINNNGTLKVTGTVDSLGAFSVNSGGTLQVAGSLGANNAVAVNGGGRLTGGGDGVSTGFINGPVTLVSGSTVGTRGAINLTDSAFGTLTLTNAAGLSLGGAVGDSSQLVFEAGPTSAQSDSLSLAGNSLTVGNGGAAITIADAGVVAGQTYTVLSFGSGAGPGFATGSGTTVGSLTLTNPNLTFGVAGTLLVGATQVQVVTSGASAPATAFWSGVRGTQWTDNNGTFGNFTTDAAGVNFIQAYPSVGTDVTFAANGNGAPENLSNVTLGKDFGVNSLTFASGTPAASIGGANTLTVGAGGITVASGNGGANLSMSTLALGASQTWSNASAQNLTVSASITGDAVLTIQNSGAGAIVLSGQSTYTGETILSAGILRTNGSGALGGGTAALTINSGTLLELNGTNQSVGNLNGSGTITNNGATNSTLSIGGGDATGGIFQGLLSDTTNAGGGTLGLTKIGNGTITLPVVNTYTGSTTLSGGVLSVSTLANGGDASSIGQASAAAASLVFDGGMLDYTGPAITIDRSFTVSAGKTGGISTANKLTLSGSSAVTTGGLTKLGPGELELTGSHGYSGRTTVNAGKLTLPATSVLNSTGAVGTGSLVVGNVFGDAVLQLSGGTINLGAAGPTAGVSGSIGAVGGSNGSLVMDGGTIMVNSAAVKQNFNTGMAGYGALTMTAGTVTLAGNFGVGTANGGRGVQNLSGGSITVNNGYAGILGNVAGGVGVANYSGTSSFTATSAVPAGGAFVGLVVGEGGAGILNVSGQASLALGGSADAAGLDIARANTASGIVNLGAVGTGGGTITTNIVRHTGVAGTGVFNFHGGKLQAATFANPTFMADLTGAYVYSEGGTVDTNGVSVTIAQALLAPTGQGLTSAPLFSIGTGYINTPLVTIEGGTLTAAGTQATAVANFNALTGEVTGITITNPGSYTDTTGLTAFFAGGGSSVTPPIPDTFVTAPNSSGGLTKTGAGTLTLSGANTYAGLTTVGEGGVLVTGSLTGAVAVANGTTFGGSGTVGAVNVASGGTIAPGATLTPGSLGTLATGNLSLNGSAQFQLEIDTGFITSDLLNVSGNLTLDLAGTAVLALSDVGFDVAMSQDTILTLIDYSGTWNGGVFAGHADDSVFGFGANQFRISYDGANGGDTAVTLMVVPEPASLTMLLASAGVMLGLRRRRRVS